MAPGKLAQSFQPQIIEEKDALNQNDNPYECVSDEGDNPY